MNPPTFDEQPQRLEPMVMDSMQRAEIDLQITTAKRYPRQLGMVKASMMSFATLDQETAESCFYSLPRGGKNIQGPSVRLAEIAVSCYGNLRAGSRVVATVTEGPNPHVVIQSVCHDLEKNVAVTMEKRRRITKKKSKDTIDEDDINLACNAGAAIAFRDCVFKVVPMALIKPVYEQAKRVAIGDAKTLVDRRARVVEAFGKMGVTKEMILGRLEKKTMDDVDIPDLETLFGLHTALKDGDTTIEEIFLPIKAAVAKPTFEATPPAAAPAVNGGAKPAAPAAKVEPAKTEPVKAPEPATTAPEDNLPMGDAPAQTTAQVTAPAATAATPPEAKTPPTDVTVGEPTPRAPRAKKPPEKGPKERLIEAGVPFDDFTDWLVHTNRNAKAKEWADYDAVSETYWRSLGLDAVGVSKCIDLFRTDGKLRTDAPAAEAPAGGAA